MLQEIVGHFFVSRVEWQVFLCIKIVKNQGVFYADL